MPPSVEALGSVSTLYAVAAPPRLLNRDVAQRDLAELLFDGGVPETRGATVAVMVRADGTVDPLWVEAGDPAHRDFASVALPGLAAMRFEPLTGGVPTPAIVWIEVDFLR